MSLGSVLVVEAIATPDADFEAGRVKEAADAIAAGLAIDGRDVNLLRNAAATAIILDSSLISSPFNPCG